MVKNLYKGVIAMNRETFILYAHATSTKQAKLIFAQRIAKKHGVLPVVVHLYMKEHPDCFLITIELEMEEESCQ